MNWKVFWAMLFGIGAVAILTNAYMENSIFYAGIAVLNTFISAKYVSELIKEYIG